MDIKKEVLSWEDLTTLELRAVYEQFGYQRYRMGKFEPYDIYLENRNFLKSETVLTFTDPSGRLMALKPDVTMSIVKNTQPDTVSQKLYYIENVFRMAPGGREYREIGQMGLEYIGANNAYAEAETILLALKSLETISPDYILSISHMGFMSAVLSSCGFDEATSLLAQNALRQKNLRELASIAAASGLSPEKKQLLLSAAGISRPVLQAIEQLRTLPLDSDMSAAIDELSAAVQALSAAGYADRVYFDFALINDMDYYNGIVFQGYIQGIPRTVLSGGRYDNLMRRFGKPQPALGFAVYLGELSRAFSQTNDYDTDILLIYGSSSPEAVMEKVSSLTRDGMSVRAEACDPGNIRAGKVFLFSDGQMTEVCSND